MNGMGIPVGKLSLYVAGGLFVVKLKSTFHPVEQQLHAQVDLILPRHFQSSWTLEPTINHYLMIHCTWEPSTIDLTM
jgi:hypothetical protein